MQKKIFWAKKKTQSKARDSWANRPSKQTVRPASPSSLRKQLGQQVHFKVLSTPEGHGDSVLCSIVVFVLLDRLKTKQNLKTQEV